MKRGEQLQIKIDKLAFGGKGIARKDNRVIFVEGGVPGDLAEIRIQKIKKNFVLAKLVNLLEPSLLRQPAPCQHFGVCGGCKWQNLDYQKQLEFKREQVVESLEHLAGIQIEKIHATLPSPLIFGYRNKMEFSFTDRRWLTAAELSDPEVKKDFALGLHVPGSFDRVMHIEKCWLQDEQMTEILNFSQDYFRNSALPVFNLKSHLGLLRFLVLRKSFYQKNYMVNVVTFEPAQHQLRDYTSLLQKRFTEIVSVINTVNPRLAQIAFGEEEYVLHGEKSIIEKLGDYLFTISANSFFQTNSIQAAILYQIVVDYCGSSNQLLWDLYSGTGTIALFLSKTAERVTGFELVESSVTDAQVNCEKNEIGNCDFVAGDLRNNLTSRPEKPDVIVCDPPRAGMHEDVVTAILMKRPQKIVYVSCNPTTMARDIKPMLEFYKVVEVQPVDMFPHTYHIESVIRLEWK
jgi:23S rRNA (uracil1939-C5)-methyltransferase